MRIAILALTNLLLLSACQSHAEEQADVYKDAVIRSYAHDAQCRKDGILTETPAYGQCMNDLEQKDRDTGLLGF